LDLLLLAAQEVTVPQGIPIMVHLMCVTQAAGLAMAERGAVAVEAQAAEMEGTIITA
jgi:hypothetical protein